MRVQKIYKTKCKKCGEIAFRSYGKQKIEDEKKNKTDKCLNFDCNGDLIHLDK